MIIGFIRSPRWKTPVHTFIDENCMAFDNEEENKLEHTEIHKKFCKIVEDLLDNLTAEFMIPHE